MPKGIHNIVDFSGGLNKVTDSRDIAENEAADLDGFLNLNPGKLTVTGGFTRPTTHKFISETKGFSGEFYTNGFANLYYVNPSHGFKYSMKANVGISSNLATITNASSHPHGLTVGAKIVIYKQKGPNTDWIGIVGVVKDVTSLDRFTFDAITGLTDDQTIYYAVNSIYDANAIYPHRKLKAESNIDGKYLFKAQDRSRFGFFDVGKNPYCWYGNGLKAGSGNDGTRSSTYPGGYTGKDPWYHDLNYLWNYHQNNGEIELKQSYLDIFDVFYDNGVLRFMPEAPEYWDYDKCIRPVGLYFIDERTNFYDDITHGYRIDSGWYSLRTHCFSAVDYRNKIQDTHDSFYTTGGTLGVDTNATSISTFETNTSAINNAHQINVSLGHGNNGATGDWQFASGAEHQKLGLGISFIYDDIDNGQESRISLLTHDGSSTGNNYITMSGDSANNNQALYLYWKIHKGSPHNTTEISEVYDVPSLSSVAIDENRGSGVNDGFANIDAWNPRIVGANVWITYMDNESLEDPLWLATINFSSDKDRHGISKSHDEHESTEWSIATGDNGCSNQWIQGIKSVPVITYRMKNGLKADENTFIWYKTSAIVNRRLYAGNVSYFNVTNPQLFEAKEKISNFPDRIIKSNVNGFDMLSPNNFLEIMSNDGQDIVKMLNYGQELLVFKNDNLYVIDCSAEYEYIKDTKYNYGVDNPLQVVRSNKYVFWLNKNGVYGYDGNEYYNFIKGKIDLDDWTNKIFSNRDKLMFDSKENLLMIMTNYNKGKYDSKQKDGNDLLIIDIEKGSVYFKSTTHNVKGYEFSQAVNVDQDLYITLSNQSGVRINVAQIAGQPGQLASMTAPVTFMEQVVASDGKIYPPGIPNVDCQFIYVYQDGSGWRKYNDTPITIRDTSGLATTMSTTWLTDTNTIQYKNYMDEIIEKFNMAWDSDYSGNLFTNYNGQRPLQYSFESRQASTVYNFGQSVVQAYSGATVRDIAETPQIGISAIAFGNTDTITNSSDFRLGNISEIGKQSIIGAKVVISTKFRLHLDNTGNTQSNIPITLLLIDRLSGHTLNVTYITGKSSNYSGTYTDETDSGVTSEVRNDRLLGNIREYLSNFGNFTRGEVSFLRTHISYPIEAVSGTSGDKHFDITCLNTINPRDFAIEAKSHTGPNFETTHYPAFGSELLKWNSETPVDIDGNFNFYNQRVVYESKEYTFFTSKTKEATVEDSGPHVKKKIYKMYITYKGGNGSIGVYYKINRAATWSKGIIESPMYKGNTSTENILKDTSNLTRETITFGSDAKNAYSFAFKLESIGGVSNFEVHDISIVYRNKKVK